MCVGDSLVLGLLCELITFALVLGAGGFCNDTPEER